ncbi:unnamed protein product [Prorocentrum cordatum]|uniref:Uncharacterized protein n=1 Tax=Prorocentrum cordatum TaxID=2364126 RepID=A0ABN9R6D0_9DINO|nr:unnamed protein product [Polarella glacialis]
MARGGRGGASRGIVVRHGAACATLATVDEAAELMSALLVRQAQRVLGAAAEVVATLGEATLAKGLQASGRSRSGARRGAKWMAGGAGTRKFEGKQNELNTIVDDTIEDGGNAYIEKEVHDTLPCVDGPLRADDCQVDGKRNEVEGITNPITMKANEKVEVNIGKVDGRRKVLEDIGNPVAMKTIGCEVIEATLEAQQGSVNLCLSICATLQEDKLQDKFKDDAGTRTIEGKQEDLDTIANVTLEGGGQAGVEALFEEREGMPKEQEGVNHATMVAYQAEVGEGASEEKTENAVHGVLDGAEREGIVNPITMKVGDRVRITKGQNAGGGGSVLSAGDTIVRVRLDGAGAGRHGVAYEPRDNVEMEAEELRRAVRTLRQPRR